MSEQWKGSEKLIINDFNMAAVQKKDFGTEHFMMASCMSYPFHIVSI